MQYKRKRKYRLKKSVKLVLALLVVFSAALVSYRIYEHFTYVQVQVANIPKPSAPASVKKSVKKAPILSDAWNYRDDNISIRIQKVQKGTGTDLVTLFVADVTLSSTGYLHTAFAKNEFGMHITQKLTQIAQNNNALFAVNGDFYGYRPDGVIVRNGILYRDNPARDMLAVFKSGTMSVLNEKAVHPKQLIAGGLLDTFSFGPALVENGKAAGSFASVFRDQWFIQGPEPRTGVGMITPDHFVFVVVDGRKTYYSRGMTLTEFAQEFVSLGCKTAYNLDGGGSSTMYFKGRVVNNPLGRNGAYERNVSDILYIDTPRVA